MTQAREYNEAEMGFIMGNYETRAREIVLAELGWLCSSGPRFEEAVERIAIALMEIQV